MYHSCCAGEPAVSGSVVRIETAGDRPLLPRPLILHEDALRAYATRRTHFVLMLHEERTSCLCYTKIALRASSPSPRSCGERVGVRGCLNNGTRGESPSPGSHLRCDPTSPRTR